MQTIKQIKRDLKYFTSFKNIDILIQDYIIKDKLKDKKEAYNNYKDLIYKILKENNPSKKNTLTSAFFIFTCKNRRSNLCFKTS